MRWLWRPVLAWTLVAIILLAPVMMYVVRKRDMRQLTEADAALKAQLDRIEGLLDELRPLISSMRSDQCGHD